MSEINLNGGSKKIILNGTTYYAGGSNSGGGSTLITKTITANGTYNASDDNADGYSSVNVNIKSNRLVVYNKFNSATYGQFVYTAEEDCTMIAFNALVNNAANNYDGMNSMITTTGTVIGTDTISDNYDSQNKVRNQHTVCKIISLSEGDTVTWTNNIPANMIDALHIGIIVDFNINAFNHIEHIVKADNNVNTGTITIPSDGIYLLISCVMAGNNNIGNYTITHPNNETVLFESIANDALVIRAKPTIFTASANDSIDYDFATFTNYVSKGYYLYKLT